MTILSCTTTNFDHFYKIKMILKNHNTIKKKYKICSVYVHFCNLIKIREKIITLNIVRQKSTNFFMYSKRVGINGYHFQGFIFLKDILFVLKNTK